MRRWVDFLFLLTGALMTVPPATETGPDGRISAGFESGVAFARRVLVHLFDVSVDRALRFTAFL